jgi:hypothetical protein
MSVTVRAVLTGVLVYLASWLTLVFVVAEVLERVADVHVAMRLAPYVNAHLMEEAEEHGYLPWADNVFLLRVFLVSATPVFAGAWVAGRRGGRRAACCGAAGCVLILVLINAHMLTGGTPGVLRLAFIGEIAVAIAYGVLGCFVARRERWRRAAQQGDQADEA